MGIVSNLIKWASSFRNREKADIICDIDPTQKIYFSDAADIHGDVREFDFLNYNLDLSGYRRSKGGYSNDKLIVVSNKIEELKELKAEILQKKIYEPSYPNSVSIKLKTEEKVVEFRTAWTKAPPRIIDRDCITLLYKEIDRYEDGLWYGVHDAVFSVKYKTEEGSRYMTTKFESIEEYEERLRSTKMRAEEDRLNAILSQIDKLTQ